jgi:phage terminase large subunit-like protein
MTAPPTWAVRTKADQLALDQGCYWQDSYGDAIIAFCAKLVKPQFVRGKFTLLQWQERYLRALYSWRLPNGDRRFKTACLHIAKKQGKTLLVAIIAAYETLRSDEPSPFVASASVSKENASQVFNEIRHIITKAKLTKHCQITATQKRIRVNARNSEYRALASDGDTAQGFNISTCIIDEAHAHKSSGLYDSLRYSAISRPNGIVIIISTAGDDVTEFYHGIYSKAKRILSGDDTDISFYAEVYEADPEIARSNPLDVKQWHAANPSLGTSFTEDSFRRDLEAARADPAEWLRFLRYRLNVWCRPDERAYFNVNDWDKQTSPMTPEQLKLLPCWLGVDLSQTTDPSSIAAVWALPDRRFYVQSCSWVARGGFMEREKSNLPKYNVAESTGHMTITDGDRIDDKLIYRHLLTLCKTHKVKSVVFDPASAFVLMSNLEEERINCLRMPQSYQYFDGPLKSLNTAILEGRIRHAGEGWLKYCLSNIRVGENDRGEIRPHRKRSVDKIDAAIATLMAFSQAAAEPIERKPSVYETQKVFVF